VVEVWVICLHFMRGEGGWWGVGGVLVEGNNLSIDWKIVGFLRVKLEASTGDGLIV